MPDESHTIRDGALGELLPAYRPQFRSRFPLPGMAPSKLTDADKQQILELYRQPGETTLTLASRYGVSNTTISRILKSNLPAAEYESLIQQKRQERGGSEATPVQGSLLEAATISPAEEDPTPEPVVAGTALLEVAPATGDGRRSRRRSSAASRPVEPEPIALAEPEPVLVPVPVAAVVADPLTEASTVETMLGEDLLDQEADLDEDEDEDDLDDDDDLDEDEDDLDDEDDGEGGELPTFQVLAANRIRVLPLADASIPQPCYLVVDRSAELIARPLKEFGDLGQIPSEEVLEKTLPVFDNHRVAKRFSNRTQRVIKIPDSKVLRKTSSHLQAKGITRLLIDGQVYAL